MMSSSVRIGTALAVGSALQPLWADSNKRRFKFGACDWSIGRHSDPIAMKVASEIGLDGVQVSLGKVGNNMHLRQSSVQRNYLETAAKYGVEIASLAIGELNSVPYKSKPETIEWVLDGIDACKALGVKVILLAFFGAGDLKGDAKGTQEVIRRLKEAAPKAEAAGVTLGIESWLSAEEHIEILQRVDSPAVKVYYDVANSNKMNYDIYSEIRRLGRSNICELHMKENGHLLGQGRVNFQELREAIDDIDYQGWLIIEGARPTGADLISSYKSNLKFLKSIFRIGV